MSLELIELLKEVRATRDNFGDADSHRNARIDQLEATINDFARRIGRPGYNGEGGFVDERRRSSDYLRLRHLLKAGSSAPRIDFAPEEIDSAAIARRAFGSYLRSGDFQRMPEVERKSLSEFTMGNIGLLVPPEVSDRILSCLADPGDLTGVVDNMTISSSAVQFLIDNFDGEELFGWACQETCAFNQPGADIAKGLSQLELRPEELRGLICASRSFLEDAAVDIEGWIARKGQQGVRRIASRAIAVGSGVGMPMGILNPNAGIPVCETSALTPAGQFTWQDLVGLLFEVPVEYHSNGVWLMNQRTLGQAFSMSDAAGRPILIQDLQNPLRWMLLGHPVIVSNFFPDVIPGATPVAFGNWKETYLLVNRRALTMLPDPYSAGWCVLYRLFARLGGGIICPTAARLLRIK
ncbi:hypothetical protein CQ12_10690 [Bradyrhizobium jicamae]|uniref:Phage capsid-like C-terminal domain-containing protein n=1 Tax=Bradyrhizobium jicamae TaxID=280332 RepID=A0A0R3M925_9BRAD|nr:phage major capsid protein [Bradyrhizobium jicamae]KRR14591.1 hypothetical protein CQ12_10690 [Bradyrhizobium jicamae]